MNSSNNPVAGSRTWYLPLRQAQCRPFGGYRPGSAPTQTITDRDFTGQRENMELGLLYYGARYYVPGLDRFASADSIIPNPASPQSYNRYSYVLNRALNFTDPTGHRETPYDLGGGGGFGPIDDRHSSPERELGMMFIRIGLYAAATAAVKQAADDVLSQARDVINSTPDLEERNKECCPIPDPFKKDNDQNYVTYLHLTTQSSAQDILANGISPSTGPLSGGDPRFFAITQESGPYPRPTNADVDEMLSFIATLLSSTSNESLALVYLRIPKRDVASLEGSGSIHYGPFLPNAEPGLTESIFEVESFSIVNQYKTYWNSIPIQ